MILSGQRSRGKFALPIVVSELVALQRIRRSVIFVDYMQSQEPLTPADLRERAGLTQRQVAIALDKRVSTISDWERKEKYPKLTFTEILQLTRLYSCTLEELAQAFDGQQELG
jgi:DNA-binding XRE family transcriptional regulator